MPDGHRGFELRLFDRGYSTATSLHHQSLVIPMVYTIRGPAESPIFPACTFPYSSDLAPMHTSLMKTTLRCFVALVTLFTFACPNVAIYADDAAALQFNKDIRPLLSSTCFRCHGFDAKTREANLRLDTEAGAFETRADGKPAITPGKLDASMIWERINSTDPNTVMPPPKANRQLSAEEKQLIGKWIEQGAKYEKHWAFEPIADRPVPQESASTDIDRFLEQQRRVRSLKAQGASDPRTLVRRLSFTLTGLPPTIADVEQFAANPTDAAYEQLIDKYLQSPDYGVEMAKHWLDVARYGDTHGLHLDNERQAWPYRDWVVNAMNANMPFDQFTTEQLAGDLLPNPTQSQLVATGFNRCNVTTSEGGAIDDEFLFRYSVDRTSTTIQAWLGLTGGCAVCHDHKYDPLSTREFYSMYAFFYSAADPAMDGNIDTTRPFVTLPTPEQSAELEQLRRKESDSFAQLVAAGKLPSRSIVDSSNEALHTQVWLDDEIPAGASQRNTSRNEPRWTEPGSIVPMGRRALYQSFGDRYEQVVSGGLVPRWVPKDGKLRAWVNIDPYESPKAIYIEIVTDAGNRRWAWANRPEDAALVGAGPDRIAGALPLANRWTEVEVSIADLAAGASVREIKFGLFGGIASWDGITSTGSLRAEDSLRRDVNAWWAKRKGSDTPLASPDVNRAIKEGPESEFGKQHVDEVVAFFQTFIAENVSPPLAKARAAWQLAKIERQTLEQQLPGSMVFGDRKEPRQAHIMTRGQYDQKGDAVSPGTPAALPPMKLASPDQRPNRLDLARWIVDHDNPLAARVAVNRYWQQVFGTGLVKTSEDFGSQGSPPSHPELLDWLAFRFRNQGWDIKRLMKELVMTAAFRQSAVVDSHAYSIDPENRYLARGPRIRLDAEQIRDNVLAVSGLLIRDLGGPGSKGYQPKNIWEPVGYGDSNTRYYVQDHGAALYRRSLYSFIKRTAPPPFMSNFDAPNREMLCARRERSNTPLQALQLMNDVQYVEAARYLAERIVRECKDEPNQRVRFAFERVLTRQPDATELAVIESAYQTHLLRFSEQTEDAKKLINTGEQPTDPKLPIADTAALTLICNLLLNLDESVTRN